MAAIDTLTASLNLTLALSAQRNVTGLDPLKWSKTFKETFSFVTGAAVALGCNELYAEVRTLAAGATENIDLAASLSNVLREGTISFARVKFIYVKLLSTKDDATLGTLCSGIRVGGHATAAWVGFFADATDRIDVDGGTADVPGGVFLAATALAAGKTVTATTGDLLKVENRDGAVAAKYLLVIGGSAT